MDMRNTGSSITRKMRMVLRIWPKIRLRGDAHDRRSVQAGMVYFGPSNQPGAAVSRCACRKSEK
jgi:hypothetical protein